MKKVISVITIIIIITVVISTVVLAEWDPIVGSMQGYQTKEGTSKITDIGGKILGAVQVLGVAIAFIMLTIIGIKYMVAAPSEKAEVKKTLVPYIIGAIILFGSSAFITIIKLFADGITTSGVGTMV